MDHSVIVMVVDPEDRKRGQITIMEDPQEAARLAEGLLEAGLEQDRIRIFNAAEVTVAVSQRPVVTLVAGEAANGDGAGAGQVEGAAGEGGEASEAAEQEGEPTPFVQNGVRFSSLFRPS